MRVYKAVYNIPEFQLPIYLVSAYIISCIILAIVFSVTIPNFYSLILAIIPLIGMIKIWLLLSKILHNYLQLPFNIEGNSFWSTLHGPLFFYYMVENNQGYNIDEVLTWAQEYCDGKYVIGRKRMFFQKSTDATLFKMAMT